MLLTFFSDIAIRFEYTLSVPNKRPTALINFPFFPPPPGLSMTFARYIHVGYTI